MTCYQLSACNRLLLSFAVSVLGVFIALTCFTDLIVMGDTPCGQAFRNPVTHSIQQWLNWVTL